MLTSPCFICNEPVELETCVVDEAGNPTHQDCYLLKLGFTKMGADTREVLDFLSSTTRNLPTICPYCGATLEQRTAKFFWAGRAWEVPLTDCPNCNALSPKI